MKSFSRFIGSFAVLIFLLGQSGIAQTEKPTKVEFAKRNLGGPRLGITYLPGNTELVDNLSDHSHFRTKFRSPFCGFTAYTRILATIKGTQKAQNQSYDQTL